MSADDVAERVISVYQNTLGIGNGVALAPYKKREAIGINALAAILAADAVAVDKRILQYWLTA